MKSKVLVIASTLFLTAFSSSGAKANVIGFDDIPEGTVAASQYVGAVISGGSVLTQDSQLNPDFPPFSNPNVLYDYLNGTIIIDFTVAGITSVGAYVTGNTSIILEIFHDAQSLGTMETGNANQLGAGTGLSPNIFLSLLGVGITRAVFSNNLGISNTFTVDDVTVVGATIVPSSAVPLPSALPLFASGLGAIGLLTWRRKRKAVAA